MNDRSIMQAPEPGRGGVWVDRYLPVEWEESQSAGPKLIDADVLRGMLFRQRWLIAITIAASLVLGVVVTMLMTPVYEAKASIVVSRDGNIVVEGQELAPVMPSNEFDNYMETQGVVIQSRSLAYEVVDALNLVEETPLVLKDIDESRPDEADDAEWAEIKRTDLATILQSSVTADVPRGARVLTIGVESEDPEFATQVVNAYAEAYVRSDARRSLEANQYAQEYLQEQIAQTRERLADAEIAANNYARQSGIINQQTSEEESSQTITGANLVSINDTVTQLRAQRIAAEQRWRAVANIPAAQLPEVQRSPAVQGLQNEKLQLETELTELRQRYNDEYPPVIQLQAQIAAIDQKIAAASADIKASIRNEFVIAQRQEQALSGELENASEETLAEQDRLVEYSVLDREAQALRDQLESLLDRFNLLSAAANVQSGMLTKLDDAIVPISPISPNLLRNMLIALIGGIGLAAGLALVREVLDDKLRSLDEVEEKLGHPLLGHTPYVDEDEIENQEANQFSALMEAYSSIRSTVDFTLQRDGAVIQLTSSQASEGKSTTALILADLFARSGRKTLLVDADLRKPSIARLLHVERPQFGFVDVLAGRVDLQSALVEGTRENLDILTLGPIPANPVEMLSSYRLRDWVERNRKEYGLIIFDTSPVLGIADAPLVSRCVDSTIFIVEANSVNFGQVRTALRRIRSVGGNILGIVLTKYKAIQAGQSYDYQYRYYQYAKDNAVEKV
ncbi:GumC family protein [Altererythrobacter lutimaris]|uniref:non-specific protein-tyrosine kinase n=1 Tax=Altererythrobacter lutimaris TaxID=2743979 RepID=A0A850HDL4_9SPHN|nr:polysaccharide biosynthesis tyrosine autokinase [Altererythrobacter lutimaris]NVE95730.1 polysaccharide biosynthesis tyrosine autokinase [Altererythrobacter lutimaris]